MSAFIIALCWSSLAAADGSGVPAVVKDEDGKYFDKEGNPTYKVQADGTVDWHTYSGFRRYHSDCHVCHGPDGMGSTYAPALKDSLKTLNYGDFLGERRLTERQIALVKAWADAGTPEGNAADLPPQPKFPDGWRLGTPDLVVSVPVRYTVPADGPDIFQHFVMPLNLPKDQTVVAFEFRPGNPAVVHHSIVAIDTRGGARARDAETPEPGWRTSGSIDASITRFA